MKQLQNGSDIRGVAMEGIKDEAVNLTEEIVFSIALSFTSWLSEKLNKPLNQLIISAGMDSRLSGPKLKKAFIEGITSLNAKAYDFGLSTTPAMYMSTQFKEFSCDGAAMITASHLPFNRNGIKFFTKNGGIEKEDVTEILLRAEKGNIEISKSSYSVKEVDFIDVYSKHLVQLIRERVKSKKNYKKPFRHLHIIVDAGNGSGGFFVDKVLKKLGAKTRGSLYLEPDGNFPHHMPNPEDSNAMRALQEAVKAHKSDMGIIFDTDVDRAAIIDSEGNTVHRNRLIALLSAIVLREYPGSYIVTDSVTSSGLSDFIKAKNGFHFRYKRGYRNVINQAITLNQQGKPCHLAIETSGHAAFKENFFLDDGCYLVTRVLMEYAKMKTNGDHLFEVISSLQEPVESTEFRIKIKDPDFREYGASVIDGLKKYVQQIEGWEPAHHNYEGLRVNCYKNSGDGWFLLRLSLHDPVLALNIESNIPEGISIISQSLNIFLKEFDSLDIQALDNIK